MRGGEGRCLTLKVAGSNPGEPKIFIVFYFN